MGTATRLGGKNLGGQAVPPITRQHIGGAQIVGGRRRAIDVWEKVGVVLE